MIIQIQMKKQAANKKKVNKIIVVMIFIKIITQH